MRIKNLILSIVSLALVFSCAREGGASDPAEREPTFRIVHYSAEVSEAVTTKATVDGGNHYIFEEGDRLYVTGENAEKLYGFLHLITGAGATTAHFEGDLYCIDNDEEFELTSSTPVSVTLVSSNDQIHSVSGGKITDTEYPDDECAADFAEAVSKFSDFTGSGTFGSRSFTLSQQSSFLIFDIRMSAADAPVETDITATLYNNTNSPIRTASITVIKAGTVPFVFAFQGGTVSLQNAVLDLEWNDGEAHNKVIDDISDQASLAANRYYTISRTPFDGFRIIADQDNTNVTFHSNYRDYLYYSLDGGISWSNDFSSAITLTNAGDDICVVGRKENYKNANPEGTDYGSPLGNPLFSTNNNKKCYISGNIMSLLCRPEEAEYDKPETWTFGTALPIDAFNGTFSKGKNTALSYIDINPSKPLVLPVTTLAERCYKGMFRKCTSLQYGPDLPATTMATGCYNSMFRDCSNLLSLRCYFSCFLGGDYVKANYDRDSIMSWLDKWMDGISTTGIMYCHPDMVTYWNNSKNQNGPWWTSDFTKATMSINWTASEWSSFPN